MTRDDAVSAFKALGYHAKPRTWSMGDTLFVSHPSLKRDTGDPDVTAYSRAVHLRPEGGQWVVLLDHDMKTCEDFQDAFFIVSRYLGV